MLNRKGFDLWADGYDRSVGLSEEENAYPFAGYRAVLGGIYRKIREKGCRSVLDIGFGTATLTARLYEDGCEIFGQDFSERMLEIAREKMPQATLVCADFTQGIAPELAGRKYDCIVSTYALHHVTDTQKPALLKSLLSLLNEGGLLLVGDVAFITRAELEQCARETEDWDDEEEYFAFDELQRLFPGQVSFERCSYCAGILTWETD